MYRKSFFFLSQTAFYQPLLLQYSGMTSVICENHSPISRFAGNVHSSLRYLVPLKIKREGHVLTILTWKNLCFAEFNTKIHWNTRLAASDVFHMFTESIKVILIPLSYKCLKSVIHQIDSKNAWLLLSVNITTKLELVFVLTFENASS